MDCGGTITLRASAYKRLWMGMKCFPVVSPPGLPLVCGLVTLNYWVAWGVLKEREREWECDGYEMGSPLIGWWNGGVMWSNATS